MSSFEAFSQLVSSRRTHKRFNGDAVAKEQLEQLLELLPWAPCHRMTQPWRAYVLSQKAVRELGDWIKQMSMPC